MEEALTSLKNSVEEQEFLRLTRTVVRIIQNILNDPDNAKFRTVRAGSKFLQQKGEVPRLLEAVGFNLKRGSGEEGEDDYVFEDELDDVLLERKCSILAARREVDSVMGWDVPSSSLKFSLVQGKGRFGDIFIGRMDDRNVMVKIMRPDCNQDAKAAFDRELDILSKVRHPNIVQLQGVTLTSDPTSLILEHVPHCLLDVLHSKDISEPDVLRYGQQLASAMQYLHQKEILHCDLAARNLLLAADDKLCLSEFGMSRWAGTSQCHLPPSSSHTLNVRWTSPETLSDLVFTKHSDIWSFGVVLYELMTGGSVPYATLSNSEVQSKVDGGYQLPQPQGCHEALHTLMRHCWTRQPNSRPSFSEIIKTHLESLAAKLACAGEVKTSNSEEEHSRSMSHGSKSSIKKSKVKELSYQSVSGKGGGLVCIYTALLSPFHRRVVVVCSRKSSVGEATATALAKCGKQDQDPKNHGLVLVNGPSSGSPAHYLDPEDKIMSVKAGVTPTAMFVLCVNMPGQAPLEIINSVRQNPAYGSAFLSGTRGYLVRRDDNHVKRSWCVLDGSTLLCYKEEEDEGVKQFESFLDFKGCSVEPVPKGKSHLFKVRTLNGSQCTFLATSKDDMLQWVESISSSSTLDPSPMLLHTSEGAVIQTGFMSLQEFAHSSNETSTVSSSGSVKPLVQRRLGSDAAFAGTYAAVDYGMQWTVLRSSGLVQCMVKGQPDTLFNLSKCHSVKVHNPREMREGVEYSIQVDTSESTLILKAALPTEHSDWVLSIEQLLQKLDRLKLIEGHRKRESGYVALKRLLLMGTGSQFGQASAASSQLYCMPKIFDDMDDVYDAPKPPPPPSGDGCHTGRRSKLLQKHTPAVKAETSIQEQRLLEESKEKAEDNLVPLPPRDYHAPPVPPRSDPPLPPKGTPSSFLQHRPVSTVSSESTSDPDADDDYVMMQSSSRQSSVPASPSNSVHYSSSFRGRATSQSPSQPITIPNRRSSKKSALLRTDSDSSSYANSPIGPSAMSSLQEGTELVTSSDLRQHRQPRGSINGGHQNSYSSSSYSLQRQNSNQSLASVSSSFFNSVGSVTPPSLPPRNSERKSSGFSSPSPLFNRSPRMQRSQSCIHRGGPTQGMGSMMMMMSSNLGEDGSKSDGVTMAEAKQLKQQYCDSESQRLIAQQIHHPISKAESISRQASFASEGYGSNQSSSEDLSELPPGWARGYCENASKYFFFNSHTGTSTWSLQEITMQQGAKPGSGWKLARTEEGQAYYYHEQTRQATWNIQETFA